MAEFHKEPTNISSKRVDEFVKKLDMNLMDIKDNAEITLRAVKTGTKNVVMVNIKPMMAWVKEDDDQLRKIIRETGEMLGIYPAYLSERGSMNGAIDIRESDEKKEKKAPAKTENKDTKKVVAFGYNSKTGKMERVSVEEFNAYFKKYHNRKEDEDFWGRMKHELAHSKNVYKGATVIVSILDKTKTVFICGCNGMTEKIANEMIFFMVHGTDKGSVEIQKKHKWLTSLKPKG